MPLERKYLVPLARALQSNFGTTPPFDLSLIFEDVPQLPEAPKIGTLVHWEKWLKDCTNTQLRLILNVLTANDEPAASAALKELARLTALANNTFAQMSDPVVNRKNLLTLLKGMLKEDRRILRVDGEHGKGKSFTADILRNFLEKGAVGTNDHVVIMFDMSTSPSLKGCVKEILDLGLGLAAGSVQFPEEDTTERRHLEHLAELLVTKAMRVGETRNCTFWIVLDRCVPTTADHVNFFHHLAQSIANHASEPRVPRLVLLEAAPDVGERQTEILVREQLDAVLRDDVQRFFEEHTRLSGGATPQLQQLRKDKHKEFAANVANIMDTAAPANYKLRLTLMGEEIRSILRKAATDGDYVDV